MDTIKYIEAICSKDGEIEVEDVKKDGRYKLVIPLFNGELNCEEIIKLNMEYYFDGDEICLRKFPSKLLSSDDYYYVCERIVDILGL